jgi:intein-encoded DNA endonuclease-like protein
MITTIKINGLNDGEKGYLIGLFFGDGYLHHDKGRHYRIYFYFNPKKDCDIVNYTIFLLKKIQLSPYTMFHHGCIIVRINSKLFYNFLKFFQLQIYEANENFIIGFISGLIDSDGYVRKGDIVITNKSITLLKKVQFFCKNIGVYSKLWNQNTTYNGRVFTIWRLRIGTRFKYKQQYSRKIFRIYGGGDCLP